VLSFLAANKNPGIAAGVLHFVTAKDAWIRSPCRPCRRPALPVRQRRPSSALQRSSLDVGKE
ncbi:hypothetical protein QIG13_27280, partial [Klebsiella pneumoniae]|nr:hypothetical protein [Klebsiella pneumoniae]